MTKDVYILSYCGSTEFASKSLKLLVAHIERKCDQRNQVRPLSYAQITRLMGAEGKYIHHSGKGLWWEIIERKLLKKKGLVQQKLFEDTGVKQSAT